MHRWLTGWTAGVLGIALLAAVALQGAEALDLARADPPPTTTTTAPPLFPPLPDAPPAAVRTPTGVVVPVLGGTDGAWEVLTPCASTAVVAGEPVGPVHVLLDPGHGGSEPGAVGPTGLEEADVNLDVALRVRDHLEGLGARVVLTRETDLRVTIESRAALANALRPLAFVSIHHNAAPAMRQDRPGSEVYHQSDDPTSRRLAGLVYEELFNELSPFGTVWSATNPGVLARRGTDGIDFFGVLRRTAGVPSILVEGSFLATPPEEALLRTPEFQDAEARAVARGLLRLLASDDPGAGYRDALISDASSGGGGGRAGCIDPPLEP